MAVMVFSHSDDDLRTALNALHATDSDDNLISERVDTTEDQEGIQIPVRRRISFAPYGRADSLCDTPPSLRSRPGSQPQRRHSGSDSGTAPTSWLRSLSKHPIITVLAGVLHVVGLSRAASTLSDVSLSSMHSIDLDEFEEEYEISLNDKEGTESPGADYGFYVAITPPHQPGFMRSSHASDNQYSRRRTEFLDDLPIINIFTKVLQRASSSAGIFITSQNITTNTLEETNAPSQSLPPPVGQPEQ